MKFRKKQARGMDLINEIAGRFTTMIEELEMGVIDCREEQEGITDQMELLNQRNDTLRTSINRANLITDNLNKLLGT